MKGHIVGYVRVSTYDQNPDRQLEGIETDKIFTDKAFFIIRRILKSF